MVWVVRLTPLEQVLRWLVVGLGTLIILEFICAAIFSPASRRSQTLNVLKAASSVIILGITLNYSLRTPVVMPGALLYLAAYLALGAEIVHLANERRRARKRARDDGDHDS